MARKKTTTKAASGSSNKPVEERLAKLAYDNARLSRVHTYRPPEDLDVLPYDAWALVKQNPVLVQERKRLATALDADGLWFVPICLTSIAWPEVRSLEPVRVRVMGRDYAGLCEACDRNMLCAMEGRNSNPDFVCLAKTENIVEITSKKKKKEAQ